MDCTQVLDDFEFDEWKEFKSDSKIQFGSLEISGKSYPIYRGENRIGRDSEKCSVTIDSKALSKEHAVIDVTDNDNHHLYDLGSTNKTRMGKLVLQPYIRYNIQDNATIAFADIKATYHKNSIEIEENAGLENSSKGSSPLTVIENDCINERTILEGSSLEDNIFDAPTQCEDMENVSINIFTPEPTTSDKDFVSALDSVKNVLATQSKTTTQQAGISVKCENTNTAGASELSTALKDHSCDQSLLEGDEDMFRLSVSGSGDIQGDKESEHQSISKPNGQRNKDDHSSGDETDPEDFFAAQTQKFPVFETKVAEKNIISGSSCNEQPSTGVVDNRSVAQTPDVQIGRALSASNNEAQMINSANCNDDTNRGVEKRNRLSLTRKSSEHSEQYPLTKDSELSTSMEKSKDQVTTRSAKQSGDSGDETDPEELFCAPTQKFSRDVSTKLPPDTADGSDLEDLFCAPTQKFECRDTGVSGQDQSANFQRKEMAHRLSETISTPTNKVGRVNMTLLEQGDIDLNETGTEDVICLATQESRRITNEMVIGETPERDACVKIQNTREAHTNEEDDESPEEDTNLKVQTERKSNVNEVAFSRGALKEADCDSETQSDLRHDELLCVPTQKIDFCDRNKANKTNEVKTDVKKQEDDSIGIYSQPTQLINKNTNQPHISDHKVAHGGEKEVQNIFSQPTQILKEKANKNTNKERKTAIDKTDQNVNTSDKEAPNELFSQPTQIFDKTANKNTSGNRKDPNEKADFGEGDSPSVLNNSRQETFAVTYATDLQEKPGTDIFSLETQKLETEVPEFNVKLKVSVISDEIYSMETQEFEEKLECNRSSGEEESGTREKYIELDFKTEQISKKDLKLIDGQEPKKPVCEVTTKVETHINEFGDEIFFMETQNIAEKKLDCNNSLGNEEVEREKDLLNFKTESKDKKSTANSESKDQKTALKTESKGQKTTFKSESKDEKNNDNAGNKVDIQLSQLRDVDVIHSISSDEDEEISKLLCKDKTQANVSKSAECNSSNKSSDTNSNLVAMHNTGPVDGDRKFDLSLDVELCLPHTQEVIKTLKELENKTVIPRVIANQLNAESENNISSPVIAIKRKCRSEGKSNQDTTELSDLSDRVKPLNEISVSISEKLTSEEGSRGGQQMKRRGKDSTGKDKQEGNALLFQSGDLVPLSESNHWNSNSYLQNINEPGTRRSMRDRRKTWKAAESNDKISPRNNKTTENIPEQKCSKENSGRQFRNLEEDVSIKETPMRTHSRPTKQMKSIEGNSLSDKAIKNKQKVVQNDKRSPNVNLDNQSSCDSSRTNVKEVPVESSRLSDKCVSPESLSSKQLECKSVAKVKAQGKCNTPKTSKVSGRKKGNEDTPDKNFLMELKKQDNTRKEDFAKSPLIVLRKLSRNKESSSSSNCQEVETISPTKQTELMSSKHERRKETKANEILKTSTKVTRRQTKDKLNNNERHVLSETKENGDTNQSEEHSASEKLLIDSTPESPCTDDKKTSIEKKNSKKALNVDSNSIRKSRITKDRHLLPVTAEDNLGSVTSSKTRNEINDSEISTKRKKGTSSFIERQIKITVENPQSGDSSASEKLLNYTTGADFDHKKSPAEKKTADSYNTRKSRITKDRNLLESRSEKNDTSSKIQSETCESGTPKKRRKVCSSVVESTSEKMSNGSTDVDEEKTTGGRNSKQDINGDSRSLRRSRFTRGVTLSPVKSVDNEENHISSKRTNDINKTETSSKRRKVTSVTATQITTTIEKAVSGNEIESEEKNSRVSRKRITFAGQTSSSVKENEKVNSEAVSLKFTQHAEENKNLPVATRKRKAASEMFTNKMEEDQECQKSCISMEEATVKLGNSTECSRTKKTKKTPTMTKNEEDKPSQQHDNSESAMGSCVKSPRSSHRVSVRPQKGSHQVLFTGLCDPKLQAAVHNLGGKVMEKPDDCNVLVTDKVRRTYKFLCVMGQGKPIVSPDWLTKSQKSGKFLDPWDFLLVDKENETKFNFCLKDSLLRCGETKLLAGFSVAVTPNVRPPPHEMKGIIESCGGTYIEAVRKLPENSFIVSCSEDKKMWPKLKVLGVSIVGTEILLLGILQQKIDLKSYVLS